MIDVTDRKEECCALIMKQCTVLIATECENCKFYKPKGCEDWIRIDVQDRIMMMTPEEYYSMKGETNEQNAQK